LRKVKEVRVVYVSRSVYRVSQAGMERKAELFSSVKAPKRL